MIDFMLGGVIGLIVGFVLSLVLAKFKPDEKTKKLKQLENEQAQYRKQVDDHFVNSAILFKGLTDQYRDVYRHIATGADELCSEEAKALHIEMAETALLKQTPDSHSTPNAQEKPKTVQPKTSNKASELKQNGDKNKSSSTLESDDTVPLASEVEMSAEAATELKTKTPKK